MTRLRIFAAIAVAVTSAAVAAPVAVGAPTVRSTPVASAAVGATCATPVRSVPWSGQTYDGYSPIESMDATAPDNQWAVGESTDDITNAQEPLVLRSTGGDFAEVPLPPLPFGPIWRLELNHVDTVAADDTWFTGTVVEVSGESHNLIGHWDGTQVSWLNVPFLPDEVGNGLLVSAASSTDVWVINTSAGSPHGVVALHFDGKRWRRVPLTPATGITSLVAFGEDDVWVSGLTVSRGDTTMFHWNGESWSTAPAPGGTDTALKITGRSDTDLWSIYDIYYPGDKGGSSGIGFAHWDGSTWTTHPLPISFGEAFGGQLDASISVSSDGTLWTSFVSGFKIGYQDNNYADVQMVARWDGTQWLGGAYRESPTTYSTRPASVVALSRSDARLGGMIVGADGHVSPYFAAWCAPMVFDGGVQDAILQQGVPSWPMTVQAANGLTGQRTLSDDLGLFQTDAFGAGQGAEFSYPTAGAFSATVQDEGVPVDSQRIQTTVAIGVFRDWQKRLKARYGIAPPGYHVDVRLQRPGAAGFSKLAPDMRYGVYTLWWYLPSGTYRLKARLVRDSDGRASGWSPVLSLVNTV